MLTRGGVPTSLRSVLVRFEDIPIEGDEDGIMIGETEPIQDGASIGASLNLSLKIKMVNEIRERTYTTISLSVIGEQSNS